MKPRVKKIILLVILISIPFFVYGQRLKKPADFPTQTVRVQESVRSPYFLPQYLALNLGFFKEQNLEVNLSTSSQEAVRAALADGRTDIALCGLQKIIFNPQASGPQPVIFATLAWRDGSLLLGREAVQSFQWQALKDKTIIGRSQDDSSEIALEDVLRRQGLRPYREVTVYNNIPDSLRIGAFRAGTGNFIQLLEPEASTAESKGYGRVVAAVGDVSGDMLVTAYAAQPGYLEANQETIRRFTSAIYKAQLWLSQHSAEEAAAAAAPSFPKLDKRVLIKSVERYKELGVWSPNPLVLRESYGRFCAAAKNAGEIAGDPTYEGIVNIEFARHAVETVTYSREIEEQKKNKKTIFNFFR